jgi:hypothetical protein
MKKIALFGIIYGDKTTEYIPYFNHFTDKLWRFENNCIIDIVENHVFHLKKDDYLGILSWKFPKKTGFNRPELEIRLSLPDVFECFDVINLSPDLGNHIHFMDWSDKGHKGIKDFIKRCCAHVGLQYNNDCQHVVYANQFITRKYIYFDYVNTVIKPCLELLEGEMWEEVNKDAGYTRAISKENLKKHTGLDFYNYIPFILERMMMQYIYNKDLPTIQLI